MVPKIRLENYFHCPRPEDAAPARKHEHLAGRQVGGLGQHPSVRVMLDYTPFSLKICQRNVDFYNGHVPNAPVLLGDVPKAQYMGALVLAKDPWNRLGEVVMRAVTSGAKCGGIALGVTIGLYAATAFFGAQAGVMAAGFVVAQAFFVAGAIIEAVESWRIWGCYRQTLENLVNMCERKQAGLLGAIAEPNKTYVHARRPPDTWMHEQAMHEVPYKTVHVDAGMLKGKAPETALEAEQSRLWENDKQTFAQFEEQQKAEDVAIKDWDAQYQAA